MRTTLFCFLFLRCKRVTVVRFVQLGRVLEVYLQDVTLFAVRIDLEDLAFVQQLFVPLEPSDRQRFAHRPAVKVVCVEVHDVLVRLRWIVARHYLSLFKLG